MFNQQNLPYPDDEVSFLDEDPSISSIKLNKESRDFIKEKVKNQASVDVITIVKEKPVFKLKKEFTIAFTENWFNLIQKSGITSVESKIVFYILDKMEFGNLISIKQSAIAKAIDMPTSNISRCFKSLIKKNILVKDSSGNTFMNSNLFSKGLSNRMSKEKYDNLKKAQLTTKDIQECF